jgi:hypothetical protein
MAEFKVFFQHYPGETQKIHRSLSKDRTEDREAPVPFPSTQTPSQLHALAHTYMVLHEPVVVM